jgi:hypothetical protein
MPVWRSSKAGAATEVLPLWAVARVGGHGLAVLLDVHGSPPSAVAELCWSLRDGRR